MLLLHRHSHSYLMHVCEVEKHTLPLHLALMVLHLVLHAIVSDQLAGHILKALYWFPVCTFVIRRIATNGGGRGVIYDTIPPV